MLINFAFQISVCCLLQTILVPVIGLPDALYWFTSVCSVQFLILLIKSCVMYTIRYHSQLPLAINTAELPPLCQATICCVFFLYYAGSRHSLSENYFPFGVCSGIQTHRAMLEYMSTTSICGNSEFLHIGNPAYQAVVAEIQYLSIHACMHKAISMIFPQPWLCF